MKPNISQIQVHGRLRSGIRDENIPNGESPCGRLPYQGIHLLLLATSV